MKWICLRCSAIFDGDNKKCECDISPSPWIPLNETTEIDNQTLMEIRKLLKRMYDMCMMDDIEVWSASDIRKIMVDGGDLYADYFRNNN